MNCLIDMLLFEKKKIDLLAHNINCDFMCRCDFFSHQIKGRFSELFQKTREWRFIFMFILYLQKILQNVS